MKTQPLHVFEADFQKAVEAYEELTSKVNAFAGLYEKLFEQPFSRKLFDQALTAPKPFFEDEYRERIAAKIDKMGMPPSIAQDWRDKAENDLMALIKKFDAIKNSDRPYGLFTEEVRWHHTKNRAVFTAKDQERIKQRYFTIEADGDTGRAVELCQIIVENYQTLQRLLIDRFGYNRRQPLIGLRGLISLQADGTLQPDFRRLFRRRTPADFEGKEAQDELKKHWENHFAPKDEFIPDDAK